MNALVTVLVVLAVVVLLGLALPRTSRATAGPMFSSRRRRPDAFDVQLGQLLDGARRPAAQQMIGGVCECCPAAAAVRVAMPSSSVLMFCGHHGRRHAPALLAQGALLTGELAFSAPAGQPVQVAAG